MSLDALNTAAAIGTLLVIAATAIAVLVQVQHLKAGSQLQAMLALSAQWNSQELRIAERYVREDLRAQMATAGYWKALIESTDTAHHPELLVATWWEQAGTMFRYGYIVGEPWLALASARVSEDWDRLAPIVAATRTANPARWVNFEYLAARAKQWLALHPTGNYPHNAERLPLPDPPPLESISSAYLPSA